MSAVRFVATLAVVSIVLHFIFGWGAYWREHGVMDVEAYLIEWGRDTFENWQSEFVQLALQFAVLAGAFKAMGVQAREEDQEQVKAKLDAIMAKLGIEEEEARG